MTDEEIVESIIQIASSFGISCDDASYIIKSFENFGKDYEMSNIEDDIKVLEKFMNNEMQRDKLERDIRCGGWKMGDIYKHLELNPAIKHILSERKQDKERIKELESKLEEANKQLDLDYVDENYIPKQKAKEMQAKIKELEEELYSANKIVEEYLDGVPKQKIKDAIEKVAEYKIARATNTGYYYDYFINQDYKEDFIKLFNKLLED